MAALGIAVTLTGEHTVASEPRQGSVGPDFSQLRPPRGSPTRLRMRRGVWCSILFAPEGTEPALAAELALKLLPTCVGGVRRGTVLDPLLRDT